MKQYVTHQYQLKNNKLYWPKILSTTGEYSKISHMNFSENLQQMYKYEAESCHFYKSQYPLHCNVVHGDAEKSNFVFYLSDKKQVPLFEWSQTTAAVNTSVGKSSNAVH